MDEEDRFSQSSNDDQSDREEQQDEPMEDAVEDADAGDDGEDENNDEDGEGEDDEDGENDGATKVEPEGSAEASGSQASPTNQQPQKGIRTRPVPSEAYRNARLYDIVPTMAAPQATSINAIAITPDMRYWLTGGSDGYIRKYDGPGTINGKLMLTVAQRHPYVDSVTKAGILMSYWENDEPPAAGSSTGHRGSVGDASEHVLSPVYSLAVHSDALWLLSGLESGGINLQSVRYDEGKRITCLQKHTNAVSVLTLAQDEKSVLSGGWDKAIWDWDLNTGHTKRSFDGSAGQISALELRPEGGRALPKEASEEDIFMPSGTFSGNNGAAPTNGFTNGKSFGSNLSRSNTSFGNTTNGGNSLDTNAHTNGAGTAGTPTNEDESLFGGGSDAGSLFGETADETQPFGGDDDEYGASMDMGMTHEGGMDHSADMAMASELGAQKEEGGVEKETTATTAAAAADDAVAPAVEAPSDAMVIDTAETTQPTQPDTQPESQPQTQPEAADEPIKLEDTAAFTESEPPQTDITPSTSHDPTLLSPTTFLSASMDGTIRLWDRRVPNPVARISPKIGVPPWCMSACWSPDGNMIYAGRRNETVEEFDIRSARRGWAPERTLKLPHNSGPVSAVRPLVNGRHLICASHDILRLYDLHDTRAFKGAKRPFLIVPGPPKPGVISTLYIDHTSRFMLSAAGTRGWEGTNTETLIGYEIRPTTA